MTELAELKRLAERWNAALTPSPGFATDRFRVAAAKDDCVAALHPTTILALIHVVEAAKTLRTEDPSEYDHAMTELGNALAALGNEPDRNAT